MDYVLINAQKFAGNHEHILLIEKQKPEWQKGKYNLVGGKVEPGEDPVDAAQREFTEETGFKSPVTSVEFMGVVTGNWGSIYCFNKAVSDFIPKNEEIEKVFWTNWKKIKDDERLMPNLRVIIPLMTMGLQGWTIVDNGTTWGEKLHTIVVSIQGTSGSAEDLIGW
jgi:8-oxo-dGTP diphosphatase